MKAIYMAFIRCISIFIVCSGFFACQEIEDRTMQFAALSPIKADHEAGKWKPILLSTPDEVVCPVPVPQNNPNYKLELVEIKSWQSKLTKDDMEKVRYWSAGTVLRWNEILRELVAKYNLPTVNNADGTYPNPNAANPLAYPYFPFSNPPYAARAYAYVSCAQYDAAIAAYHYKALYKRQKPAVADPEIIELIPVVDDYTYPSKEAVIAGAAAAMMKLLFPGEQAYIDAKLQECLSTRVMAGANTRDELKAGVILGETVAAKYLTRARNDNASKASGTSADWKKLADDAIAKGETPWMSLEIPARPPMLPLFGKVNGFLVDSAGVVALRPGPPPSVNSQKFKEELDEVLYFSKNATRERIRIVHFWADGVGTYTPPGHWNAIACEDFVKLGFSEARWARNLALLNMAMFDAAICCWDTKNYYFNPRPSQINPNIKTSTGIPNFPAYTSGHSSFSFAAAEVLAYIHPQKSDIYYSMADEASNSRLYGAIHYRSDTEVGELLGKSLGEIAVNRGIYDGAD
jgi:hypothetical protein